jgi:hypothetical protein
VVGDADELVGEVHWLLRRKQLTRALSSVFADCKPGMKIVEEEIFGPVMAVQKFETEEEVLELANNVSYGALASALVCESLTDSSPLPLRACCGSLFQGHQSVPPCLVGARSGHRLGQPDE